MRPANATQEHRRPHTVLFELAALATMMLMIHSQYQRTSTKQLCQESYLELMIKGSYQRIQAMGRLNTSLQWMTRGRGEGSRGEHTDRHSLLLASLCFGDLLDGPGINGFHAVLLSLDLLLADGCGRPV